jgi:PAS domain S-box-containing protein
MPDQTIQVLLVEDGPTDALIVREELTLCSGIRFNVTHVERLAEAFEQLKEQVFGVVLLDLSLPDSDGFETFTRLREKAADTPVIVLSGRTDENLAIKAVQSGAQDYLVKGHMEDHVLARAIRYAIERKRSETLLRQQTLVLEEKNLELNLLSTCITNLNDIVLITEAAPIDEPGPRIVFVNEAFERIVGYTPDEALGRSPRFLQGEKTDRAVLREIHQALAEQKPIRRSLVNYGKDGSEYWLDIDISPVFDQVGKCTHFVAIERDITKSKKNEVSLKLFRALMDQSNDAITVIDPETGRFLDLNQKTCERLGYTREEMLLMSIPDIEATAITQASLRDHLDEVRSAGFKILEGNHRRKDGSTFPVEVSVQYIYLDRGYVVAVVRDTTERKKAEDVLRASETRYRSLVAATAQIVWTTDVNGQITEELPEWQKFTGQSTEAIQGNGWADALHPDDVEQTLKVWGEAVQNRTNYDTEFRLYRHDGIYRNVSARGVPVLNPDGSVREWVGCCMDITERKESVEKIAEQAAFLDKTQDAIIVRDLKGEILFWNKGAEEMYGWPREEIIGRHMEKHLYANPKKFEEVTELTISQGEWSGELLHLARDGHEIIVEARTTLIRDRRGRPKSVLSIKTDVTEKRKTQAQFLRSQRMESIGTLAGGIAHDLNNILAPIMMSIDLLKSPSDTPQKKKILQTIEVSAKRGADIVRQVLSFARGLEGDRIEVQLNDLLKDLQTIITDTFPKDIRLQFTYPQDTWVILGDPTQLHQVLLNLCVNARDAMHNGGELIVSAENSVLDDHYAAMNLQSKSGRYVKINVTDTGMGIPPKLIDKIFEPFFTTKELAKGTGLGLSTVMAIVKSHEGMINVYSEQGKGTTFSVYLPAADVSSESRKAQTCRLTLPQGNGETVLVVDDETSILTITSQTLEKFGYRVLTATDGADAVAVYLQHRDTIAVVLTDMMMPVMDGPAMTHALTRINPTVKIIAASGLNANGGKTNPSGTGVKHFLTKPYTAGTLCTTLRMILDEK